MLSNEEKLEALSNSYNTVIKHLPAEQQEFLNKSWDSLTTEEKEVYFQFWEQTPGTTENAIKTCCSSVGIKKTVDTLHRIRDGIEAAGGAIDTEFNNMTAEHLLQLLERAQAAQEAQKVQDLEVLEGEWIPWKMIKVRIGSKPANRKVYPDVHRNELYITHHTIKYYQSDFERGRA